MGQVRIGRARHPRAHLGAVPPAGGHHHARTTAARNSLSHRFAIGLGHANRYLDRSWRNAQDDPDLGNRAADSTSQRISVDTHLPTVHSCKLIPLVSWNNWGRNQF